MDCVRFCRRKSRLARARTKKDRSLGKSWDGTVGNHGMEPWETMGHAWAKSNAALFTPDFSRPFFGKYLCKSGTICEHWAFRRENRKNLGNYGINFHFALFHIIVRAAPPFPLYVVPKEQPVLFSRANFALHWCCLRLTCQTKLLISMNSHGIPLSSDEDEHP